MKAWILNKTGGIENLVWGEIATPKPAEGQLLVKNLWVGLNFVDIYHRTGVYALPSYPAVIGQEALGEVVDLGANISGFQIGDLVAFPHAASGTFAEYTLAKASATALLPKGTKEKEFISLMLQGMTAHYLAQSVHELRAGEKVLILAAAGGVGHLLTQISAHLGAEVYALVSNAAKKAFLASLLPKNAKVEILIAPEPTYASTIKERTGKGVDVVYDSIGQATFQASLQSLRPRGLMVSYGNASGPIPTLDVAQLNRLGSLFFTRPSLAHFITSQAELQMRADALLAWLREGVLQVHIGHEFSLSDLPKAMQLLESRRSTGKILLKV